jgi:SAM-dependent MidA family methyltransferase
VCRVIGAADDGIEELRVGLEGNRFAWIRAPAAEALHAHLARLAITLDPGQIGEISLDAAPLHRRLARAIERGRLVAFDYGHRARILYHPLARRLGTLAVHALGRRGGDPLEGVGDVDLTAHVDWDGLIAAGETEGLRTAGVFRQGSFLAQEGLFDFVSGDAERWRAYRLVDPEGMGEELSVLIQYREI